MTTRSPKCPFKLLEQGVLATKCECAAMTCKLRRVIISRNRAALLIVRKSKARAKVAP